MLGSDADAIGRRVKNVSADRQRPVIVAIDGGSGSGKSVLASRVARALSAALIQTDDFYAAHIPDAEWDRRGPAAKVADVLDWRRLRNVLEPLRRGQAAEWYAFDFEAVRPDGTFPLKREPTRRDPAEVIVMEGAYST